MYNCSIIILGVEAPLLGIIIIITKEVGVLLRQNFRTSFCNDNIHSLKSWSGLQCGVLDKNQI
jgi:hypothetical protein